MFKIILAASAAMLTVAPASAANWIEVTGFGLGTGRFLTPFEDHSTIPFRPYGLAFTHIFDADATPECGGGNSPRPTCEVTFSGQSYALNYSVAERMSSTELRISQAGGWSFAGRGGQFGLQSSGTINLSINRLTDYAGSEVFSFQTAAVPEPATWAMMIGGFGLVGGAMRRCGFARHLA